MSVVSNFKKELINKISALSSVQQVYGWENNNPQGFPSVMVTNASVDGEFFSNAENRRVYAFRVMVLFDIGSNLQGAANDRVQEAERIVAEVVEEILNAVDTDYTFSGAPDVLWVDAVDSDYGYVEYDGGWAKSAEMTIRINTDKVVA